MVVVSTTILKLRRSADDYWRTSWYDDDGGHHQRSFGKHVTAARNRFSAFYVIWRTDAAVRNPASVVRLTLSELWDRYKAFATDYYRRADGTQSGEAAVIGLAMKPTLALLGDVLVDDLKPALLEDVRAEMIAKGWARTTINSQVHRVRRVIAWGVSKGFVHPLVLTWLRSMRSLSKGRSEARETAAVRPAPIEHVQAVVDKASSTLAAMIEVQLLTGMRPGELCAMRPVDVDVTAAVWMYRPVQHKTLHIGRDRVVPIGPKAQRLLRKFWGRAVESPVFNPLEVIHERFAQCGTHRHQAVGKPVTQRRVGPRYGATSYARAIRRLCDELNIPRWSPNQLRHNAATALRKAYGLDVAQVVLGHARADVTQIYAELDVIKAVAVMEAVG
jgi:integrase